MEYGGQADREQIGQTVILGGVHRIVVVERLGLSIQAQVRLVENMRGTLRVLLASVNAF